MKRTRYSKRDVTHNEVIKAMKSRMGGYFKDQNGGHHAHLLGLPVDAIDLYKVGGGIPDWLVYVSWLPVMIEIKNPERTLSKKSKQDERIYINGRFTPDEIEFANNFHGLRVVMFEQNEIFDYLCKLARFVIDTEHELTLHMSDSYRSVFFQNMIN